MFKTLGLLAGLLGAAIYFDLIPLHWWQQTQTHLTTASNFVEEQVQQEQPETPEIQDTIPVDDIPEQPLEQVTATPEIKQFVFFPPFTGRTMAQGMATKLSDLTGYTINVVEQSGKYRLSIYYGSPRELILIEQALRPYIG